MKIKIMPKIKIKDQLNLLITPPYLFYFEKMNTMPEEGVFYYTDDTDEFMHKRGLICACATIINFNMEDGSTRSCPTILHDSGFNLLPDNVKNFLVHHEIGHIKNSDLNNINQKQYASIMLKRSLGFTNTIEIKADAYAASVIGKANALNALAFLIRETNLPLFLKIEVRKRYNALKKTARCE